MIITGRVEDPFWKFGTATGPQPTIVITDGAWKKFGKVTDMARSHAGAGWVIGTPSGVEREGQQTIRALSPIHAELTAIWLALQEVACLDTRVEVQTDCMEVIHILKNPTSARMEVVSISKDILSLIYSFDYFCCSKVPRSVVARAHFLASKARKAV